MLTVRMPKSVNVTLALPLLQISGTWEPSDAERRAAWELYVELITRSTVVSLHDDEGLLRETLTSLYSLFPTTRDVLRHYGPDLAQPKPAGQYNLGYLAVAMLNFAIRPLLARWHPALEDWEHQRPTDRSRHDHEQAWPQAAALRAALDDTRKALGTFVELLAAACGIPSLLDAATPPDRRQVPSSAA
jgi:hypothetical protein